MTDDTVQKLTKLADAFKDQIESFQNDIDELLTPLHDRVGSLTAEVSEGWREQAADLANTLEDNLDRITTAANTLALDDLSEAITELDGTLDAIEEMLNPADGDDY
jgi:hypothetical protein